MSWTARRKRIPSSGARRADFDCGINHDQLTPFHCCHDCLLQRVRLVDCVYVWYTYCGCCRLVSSVFRLCEVEDRATEARLAAYLSPQVSSSCMWFLQNWVQAYLLPNEQYYSEVRVSVVLVAELFHDMAHHRNLFYVTIGMLYIGTCSCFLVKPGACGSVRARQ